MRAFLDQLDDYHFVCFRVPVVVVFSIHGVFFHPPTKSCDLAHLLPWRESARARESSPLLLLGWLDE